MPSPSYVPVIATGRAVTSASLTTTGDVTVGDDLAVTGDSALTGTLGVTGATSLTTVSSSGLATLASASVTGNLSVTGVGQDQVVVKSANTSRNTTVAPADDPHLLLPVTANATYLLECTTAWTNGGGGMRFDWTGPAGATMVWTDNDGVGVGALGTDVTFTTTNGCTIKGALVVAGTAGNVTLRWAQNTSNAADTVLLAGCYLWLRRVI